MCKVTNQNIDQIGSLTTLRTLSLHGISTEDGDSLLAHLSTLTNLSSLYSNYELSDSVLQLFPPGLFYWNYWEPLTANLVTWDDWERLTTF